MIACPMFETPKLDYSNCWESRFENVMHSRIQNCFRIHYVMLFIQVEKEARPFAQVIFGPKRTTNSKETFLRRRKDKFLLARAKFSG